MGLAGLSEEDGMVNQNESVPEPRKTPGAPGGPPKMPPPIASEHKTPTPGQRGNPKGNQPKRRPPEEPYFVSQ
jgi:hypothetical protein